MCSTWQLQRNVVSLMTLAWLAMASASAAQAPRVPNADPRATPEPMASIPASTRWDAPGSAAVFRPDPPGDLALRTETGSRPPRSGAAASSWLGQPLVKTGCALSAVLFTFFTLAWLVKKRGPRPTAAGPSKTIELLQRVPINARQYLQLIRLGDRVLLLAVAPNACRTLSEITDPMEVHRLSGRPAEALSALPEVMRSMLQDHSPTGADAVFQRQA